MGVLTDNLRPSQLSYFLIKEGNKFLRKHPKSDLIAFCQYLGFHVQEPKFATMHLIEGQFYDGDAVIATDMNTCETLLNCFTAKERYFYVWDLFWVRDWNKQQYNYFAFNRAFNSLKLIFRSMEHLEATTSCFNIQHNNLYLMEDFKFDTLRKVE